MVIAWIYCPVVSVGSLASFIEHCKYNSLACCEALNSSELHLYDCHAFSFNCGFNHMSHAWSDVEFNGKVNENF